MDERELVLFLIQNKDEILQKIKLQNFDDKKTLFFDFSDDFREARKRYIVRETILFLVEELDLDYSNLQEVVDYSLLGKLWSIYD